MRQDNLRDPTPDLRATLRWQGDVLDTARLVRDGVLRAQSLAARDLDHEATVCAAPVWAPGELIAEREGAQVTVVIPEDTQAVLHPVGAGPTDLGPGQQIQLEGGARLLLRRGAFELSLERVAPIAPLAKGRSPDWDMWRTGALSGLAHVLFILASFVVPPSSAWGADDLSYRHPTTTETRYLPSHPPRPKRGPVVLQPQPAAGPTGRGSAQPRRSRAPARTDREVALDTGLLQAFKGAGLASLSVLSSGAPDGLEAAMAGLKGAHSLAAGALAGLESRGGGSGGQGESVAIGGLKTRGGRGPGISLISRGGGHRTVALGGRILLIGGLDRPDIARVMRRNEARFKYCYERQLQANPNLQGKLTIRFRIAPNGQVAGVGIDSSTLEDSAVESCVSKVTRTLSFPAPRGGGVVEVSYPFIFVQGG